MSAICGIIYKKQKRAERSVILKMLSTLSEWKPDKSFLKIHENVAFAANLLFSRRALGNAANLIETNRYILLFDARFDQHQPVDKELTTIFNHTCYLEVNSDTNKNNNFDNNVDNYVVNNVVNYVDIHADQFVQKLLLSDAASLRGDFAIAVWDKYEEKLILLRDQFGKRPLFYTDTKEYFAFATEIKAFFALPGFKIEMDDVWIADSISGVKSEKDRTPYSHIKRVLPAHRLLFDLTERKSEKYWDLIFQPDVEQLKEEEAVEIFNEKLSKAVVNTIRDSASVGSELSGGLDSSGITALAWHFLKGTTIPFYALSHAFSDSSVGKYFPYKDEREFSNALIEYAGIPQHLFCTAENKGILKTLKKSLDIQSGPTQQGYNIFADSLYENAAQKELRILLSGFGGDEGATSQGAGYYQELIDKKMWQQYKSELIIQAGHKNKSIVKALLKYHVKRYNPISLKQLKKLLINDDWVSLKYRSLAFDGSFGERMSVKERFFERVGFPDDNNVRARQYKRILHDHVSQRFEYSYIATQQHRIEYAYPFWDVDLIQFYYSLPTGLKVKNGQRRYIYRESMKGLLPEKIRMRDDKTGATIPTVQMRFMKDYQKIRGLILHSKDVNKFHYLDYDKMLEWTERIKNRGFKDKIPANPGVFFNSLQILLLQEMERNGEFRSGILV